MIYRLKKEDNYRGLALQAGDTVLFQRGSVIHDLLDTVPGVRYGAYIIGNNDTTVNYSNNVQTVCAVYDSCRIGTPLYLPRIGCSSSQRSKSLRTRIGSR